jgi:hypothetical protein
VARDGVVVTIAYAADRDVESCAASFAGQAASCAPPDAASCACTFTVGRTTPEGSAFVVATATHAGRTGTATGTGAVDRTAPAIHPALLEIVRRGVGEDDAVAAAPGAVVDVAGYAAARVVLVRVWDRLGRLLASTTPDADGSFAATALPATDGATPETLPPAEVLVSAVDAAGNESAPVAIPAGAAVAGPDADPDRIVIARRALGSTDAVLGTSAAFTGRCAVTDVEVQDEAGDLLGAVAAAADGSFPEVAIGTGTASYPRVFVRATDKCGLTGARAEVLAGRDVDPPVVDPTRIVLHASASPAPDGVSGDAGAVADTQSPVREVRLADASGQPLGSAFVPAQDGSFPAVGIGDTALDRVRVQAVDKAGNTSGWFVSRKVEALLTLAGRRPHDPTSAPAALYAFADPTDPRSSGPGEALALGDEVDLAALAGASAPGGTAAHLSAAPLPDTGAGWAPLAGGPRQFVSAALDSDRDRVIVFGGADGVRVLDETWEHDGVRWARIETPHAPPPRTNAAMAYDSTRHVTVLFGGLDAFGTVLGDTWLYDGADWTEVVVAPAPAPRWDAGMVFDTAAGRERTVLFGGCADRIPCELSDTWEFDGLTWVVVQTQQAPPARFGAAVAYDPVRLRTVIFGGGLDSGLLLGDHWEYDGSNWSQRSGAGMPPARRLAAMAYDAGRAVAVMHGGDPASVGEETWELDGATGRWSAAPASTAVGPRAGHALLYGALGAGTGAQILAVGGGQLDDLAVLAYDGASWTAGAPALPSGRARAPIAYDIARGRLLVHGNGADPFPPATDTWAATGPTFAPVATALDPALGAAAMAYDTARGKVVLFGCAPGVQGACGTWEDSGAGWVPTLTAHVPTARTGHALAYDGGHGRIVLFGGTAPNGTTPLGDTWFYDGVDWTPAALSGAPTARRWAALAYDAARDRVVLFGGNDGAPRDDTWELEPTRWAPRQTASRPPALEGAGMAYDPYRRVVTLYSDEGATWDLDGAGWSGPVPAAAGPRSQAALAFDASRHALDLFGGTAWGSDVGDLWTLDRHPSSPVWATHAAVFTLDARASLASATVLYAGAARGDLSGAASFGVELLAWDWDAASWVSLGTTDASDPAAGVIQTALSAPARFCRAGRIVLLAAPMLPSSSASGAIESEVWTDDVELRAAYVLP